MYVRPMRRGDIMQVARIDREAFPTEWPPTNFSRELENRLAYYIVVSEGPTVSTPPGEPISEKQLSGFRKRLLRLFNQRTAELIENEFRKLLHG